MKAYGVIAGVLLLSLPAGAADRMTACRQNRDCVVMFDAWCLMPAALNRTQLGAWLRQDAAQQIEAERKRQTCETYDDRNVFYAFCENGNCAYGIAEKPAH